MGGVLQVLRAAEQTPAVAAFAGRWTHGWCVGAVKHQSRSAVEALAKFTQAGQAWASVQGFDVVDEFGDAR